MATQNLIGSLNWFIKSPDELKVSSQKPIRTSPRECEAYLNLQVVISGKTEIDLTREREDDSDLHHCQIYHQTLQPLKLRE
jgi:hypothetical protein